MVKILFLAKKNQRTNIEIILENNFKFQAIVKDFFQKYFKVVSTEQ